MTTVTDLSQYFLHIGHRTSTWNPKMKAYLYGQANGVHIFDLSKTLIALEEVRKFLAAAKLRNARVLFVGTKPQATIVLRKKLADTNHFYIDNKWQPGLLTNFTEIRKRVDHYLNLKSQFDSGEINKYTKKEISKYHKQLEKLKRVYRGVTEMRQKPDIVIAFDAVDRLAIEEAHHTNTAVIAVTDSNACPGKIDYPIPANDDSVESIEFLLDYFLASLSK